MLASEKSPATLGSRRNAAAVVDGRIDVWSERGARDLKLALDRQHVLPGNGSPLRHPALRDATSGSQSAPGARGGECGLKAVIGGVAALRAGGGGGHAFLFRDAKGEPQVLPKETGQNGHGMTDGMPSHTRITERGLRFGRRIAEARANSGLSQAALATKIGVSSGAISQWETGRAVPEAEKFTALADALGVEPSWLLTGDEPDEVSRAQTTSEVEALQLFRMMRPDEQARALQVLEALASTPNAAAKVGGGGPKKHRDK